MIGSTPPRRPNARRLGGIRLVAALRLRTVASLRPPSLACRARVARCVLALLGSRRPGRPGRRGTNHPDRRSRRDLATPITQGEMSEFASEPLPDPDPDGVLLGQFLDLLPPLPTSIGVFSAGGVAEVVLADLDRGMVIGYAPQMLMQPGLVVVCPLRDQSGGGFDVSLRIEKAYFQSSNQTLLHLRVIEIVHQPGHRRTKRARRTDEADAVVLRSKILPDGERFRVRTADISEGGVAFVTEPHPAVGDRMMPSVWT